MESRLLTTYCQVYIYDWTRIWEKLEEATRRRLLNLKRPRLPKELQTLRVALDFANIIKRAINFRLRIGRDIRANIGRVPLLSRVVDDLIDIGTPSGIPNIQESVYMLVSIFDYIKLAPRHMTIYKPLTGEIYMEGHWQPRPKEEEEGIITRLLRHAYGESQR